MKLSKMHEILNHPKFAVKAILAYADRTRKMQVKVKGQHFYPETDKSEKFRSFCRGLIKQEIICGNLPLEINDDPMAALIIVMDLLLRHQENNESTYTNET